MSHAFGEHPLDSMTKAELLALGRHLEIKGRSRMTKAELLAAIRSRASANGTVVALPAGGQRSAEGRRHDLYERLAALVDPTRRCPWRSDEDHVCGLPPAAESSHCVLHGGADVVDLAIPATGRLGFDTWPKLLRHLWLATYDVDPIGLDPIVAEMAWHVANFLYYDYFRVEVEGIEHVPMAGPAVIVANHGGAALPYDAAMLQLAVANEADKPRRVRVTGTEIFNILPFASHLYRKVGAAYAERADADHILGSGHLLGVFPEGERGFMKPVSQAYQVQRFGRGGFVDVAERHAAPIVPVAIVGSEEVHPAMFVSKRLARVVRAIWPEQRVEGIAVALNPFPLPVHWRIRFLPAMEPEAAEPDPLRILERSEETRRRIQASLDDMLAKRKRIF